MMEDSPIISISGNPNAEEIAVITAAYATYIRHLSDTPVDNSVGNNVNILGFRAQFRGRNADLPASLRNWTNIHRLNSRSH